MEYLGEMTGKIKIVIFDTLKDFKSIV